MGFVHCEKQITTFSRCDLVLYACVFDFFFPRVIDYLWLFKKKYLYNVQYCRLLV